MGPSYSNGTPWRKKTTAGSFFGLYNRTSWLLVTFTTSVGKFSLKSSRILYNSVSYLSQSTQSFLAANRKVYKSMRFFFKNEFTYKTVRWKTHPIWFGQPNRHLKWFRMYLLLLQSQTQELRRRLMKTMYFSWFFWIPIKFTSILKRDFFLRLRKAGRVFSNVLTSDILTICTSLCVTV